MNWQALGLGLSGGGLAVALAFAPAGAAVVGSTPLTEQLGRGAGVYLMACAMCHGDQLQGAGAEALAGDHVRQTYRGLPPRAVYGLLSGLHGHLPPLTEQEALDVTAFVLDANRLPLPPSGVQSDTLDHPALP